MKLFSAMNTIHSFGHPPDSTEFCRLFSNITIILPVLPGSKFDYTLSSTFEMPISDTIFAEFYFYAWHFSPYFCLGWLYYSPYGRGFSSLFFFVMGYSVLLL